MKMCEPVSPAKLSFAGNVPESVFDRLRLLRRPGGVLRESGEVAPTIVWGTPAAVRETRAPIDRVHPTGG
jgi:hypothetical protein